MKKMFVLFTVLVLIMSIGIGVGCKYTEPKDGEKLTVEKYEKIEVVRGRVLGYGSTIPGHGFILVTNPKDSDFPCYFKRVVMVGIDGLNLLTSEEVISSGKYKTGQEIFFTLVSSGKPAHITPESLSGQGSPFNQAIEVLYSEHMSSFEFLINPKK